MWRIDLLIFYMLCSREIYNMMLISNSIQNNLPIGVAVFKFNAKFKFKVNVNIICNKICDFWYYYIDVAIFSDPFQYRLLTYLCSSIVYRVIKKPLWCYIIFFASRLRLCSLMLKFIFTSQNEYELILLLNY